MIRKLIERTLSAIFFAFFVVDLLFFHPVEVIAWNLFGRKAHKNVVDLTCAIALFGVWMLGTRIRCIHKCQLPKDRPLIIVANHQSFFDILAIIVFLRKHYPIFVSKKSLERGIPFISYNLRKSGAALIDRQDPKQSVREILRLGEFIHKTGYSAAIFPEGTRSKGEGIGSFALTGFSTLLKKCPNALIVPFSIHGCNRLCPTGNLYPLTMGQTITFTVLPPIEPAGRPAADVLAIVEADIKAEYDLLEKTVGKK